MTPIYHILDGNTEKVAVQIRYGRRTFPVPLLVSKRTTFCGREGDAVTVEQAQSEQRALCPDCLREMKEVSR